MTLHAYSDYMDHADLGESRHSDTSQSSSQDGAIHRLVNVPCPLFMPSFLNPVSLEFVLALSRLKSRCLITHVLCTAKKVPRLPHWWSSEVYCDSIYYLASVQLAVHILSLETD